MKKCDSKRKKFFIIVERKRTHKNLKRKRLKKRKLIEFALQYDKIITAPKYFTLGDSKLRSKFLKFIYKLRALCSKARQRILIDFNNTEHMVSDGTLLFRAHFCRLVSHQSYSSVRIKYSSNNRINQVLQQIGVLDLVGQHPNIETDDPDVVNWRYAEGAGALGEKFEEILGPYQGTIAEPLQRGLYLGLTEAMTNTRQHAYPERVSSKVNNDDGTNEWWMFSQEKDGRIYVVFCDLGVGIPTSLPEKQPRLWEKLLAKVSGFPPDSRIISEAIKHSRSRTGHEYRGKGLGQLTSVLAGIAGGDLRLFSNHGCYNLIDGNTSTMDYRDSIRGTLISWSLPLTD
ncbi:MAG: hypothetical protein B6D73_14245 [gamma proteobacterium symbiont of Stewartia floridana]|nr:MAG: hypothetical protein B6D73_14245 [gamma proteobacterium symbiont of Stewartia floridana]